MHVLTVIWPIGGDSIGRKLDDVLDGLSAEEREAVNARTEEILAEIDTLQFLRQHLNIPQADLARDLGVSQPAVSKVETKRAEDLSLAMLERYVAALGGDLDVIIRLPHRPPVRLQSFRHLCDEAASDSGG
mgnify:CR=1 FL=1